MTIEAMRRVEAEIRARGHNLKWLADTLKVESQNINNWKTRGIPRTAQRPIADALGWSLDQLLAGTAPEPHVGEDKSSYANQRERAEWIGLYSRLSAEDRAAIITTAKLLARKNRAANRAQ